MAFLLNLDPFEIENGTYLISQHPILNKENNANSSKHGRQILKQYLQEIGYTENIIDIRSSRLRSLLGLKSNGGVANSASSQFQDQIDILTASANSRIDQLANILNNNNNNSAGTKQQQQQQLFQINAAKKFTQQPVDLDSSSSSSSSSSNGPSHGNSNGTMNSTGKTNHHQSNEMDSSGQLNGVKCEPVDSSSSMLLMSNVDFNGDSSSKGTRNRKMMGDVDAEGDDQQQSDKHLRNKNNIFNIGPDSFMSSAQQQDQQPNGVSGAVDADTEDALKEFSFLSNDSSYADDSAAVDWNVDKAQLMKLTEQYKKDRKTTKSNKQQLQQQQQQQNSFQQNENASINSQRPNRNALQAMISNLTEDGGENQQRQSQNQSASSGSDSSYPPSTSTSGSASSTSTANSSSGQPMSNLNLSKTAKLFLEDDSFSNDANLGELSRFSVSNSLNNGGNVGGVNDETMIEVRLPRLLLLLPRLKAFIQLLT